MAVLKNKTQGNYTLVSQNIMTDKTLSLAERGLLLTLLSLPDNWNFSIKGLTKILPEGKDKISTTLNSLIEKGYVTREQSRSSGGRFNSTDLEVHETPVNSTNPSSSENALDSSSTENVSTEGFAPCPEMPRSEIQVTEEPLTVNPQQYNINKSNNKKSNIKRVCSDTLTDSEYDDLVDEFGKSTVDYQIQRINSNGYKGCLNFDTIKKWCKERLSRAAISSPSTKKNTFCDFEQRNDIDINELEAKLLCN